MTLELNIQRRLNLVIKVFNPEVLFFSKALGLLHYTTYETEVNTETKNQ
jgi:hypothetical protein